MTKLKSTVAKITEKTKVVKDRHHTQELREERHKLYAIIATLAVILEFYLDAFVFTDKYYNVTGTRGMTTIILAAVAIAALFYAFCRFKWRKRLTPFDIGETISLMTAADWGMVLYLVAATVSSILSKYPNKVLLGDEGRYDGLLTQYAYASLYFMASRLYKHRSWFDIVFSGVVFAFTALGVLQFFGINAFGLYGDGKNLYNLNFMTLYGNINIVSTVSGIMTVYFGLLFIKSDEKYMPVFGAASCCALFTQAMAGSDSGWVNIAAGLISMIPFIFVNRKRILRYGMLIGGLGIMGFLRDWLYENCVVGMVDNAASGTYTTLGNLWLGIVALGVIIWLAAFILGRKIKLTAKASMIVCWALVACILIGGVLGIEILGAKFDSGNIHQAREMLHGNLDDNFMSGRGYIWKTCFSLIKYNPIFGSGPDTLGNLHSEVYGDDAAVRMGVTVDKAHNEYIQYAVCEGLVGLAGYLICVVGVLVLWVKRKRWHDDQPAYIFAAGGTVIAYLCQAVFNLSVPISAPYFFIFLGFAANRQTYEETKII